MRGTLIRAPAGAGRSHFADGRHQPNTNALDTVALCNTLRAAAHRLAQRGKLRSTILFWPDGNPARVTYAKGALTWSADLLHYRPYFDAMEPEQLVQVILQSVTTMIGGAIVPIMRTEESQLQAFVHQLLDHKVTQAAASGSMHVDVAMKVFGPGMFGDEIRTVTDMVVKYLGSTIRFPGTVAIHINAFDRFIMNYYRLHALLSPRLHDAARRTSLKDRLTLAIEFCYGDLTSAQLWPHMAAYGAPDISVWRNTHVFTTHPQLTQAHGEAMIEDIRRNLSAPGILFVDEEVREQVHHKSLLFHLEMKTAT